MIGLILSVLFVLSLSPIQTEMKNLGIFLHFVSTLIKIQTKSIVGFLMQQSKHIFLFIYNITEKIQRRYIFFNELRLRANPQEKAFYFFFAGFIKSVPDTTLSVHPPPPPLPIPCYWNEIKMVMPGIGWSSRDCLSGTSTQSFEVLIEVDSV